MSMNANELVNLYAKMGVKGSSFQISDGSYGIPTKKWLLDDYAKWYREDLEDRGLATWFTNNDCDNFAWRFWDGCQWAHFTSQKSTAEGLSVGVFYYMSKNGGHAINTAVTDNKEIIFIEPQMNSDMFLQHGAVTLTPEEIRSCWLIHF